MTGLVGWWPLHETSGNTAYDLSGNENHGSLNGGVTQGVAGKGGLTAYSFDGNDDYIGGFDTTPFETNQSHTVSGWYKTSDIGDKQPLIQIDRGISVTLDNTGSGYASNIFQLSTPGGKIEYSTNKSDDNQWHHFIGIYNNDKQVLELYIDGVLEESTLCSYSADSISEVKIGSLTGNPNYPKWFGGLICDLRYYNRALSSIEAKKLFDWGSGDYTTPSLSDGSDSGAVSRWRFDSSANDYWSGNHGTLNGDASVGNSDAVRGGSLSLDGSGDYVEVSDTASLNPAEITISLWMNVSTSDNNDPVIEKTTGVNNDGYAFYDTAASSNYWYWNVVDTSGNRYALQIEDEDINQGEWQHVILIYSVKESKVETYVNGVRVSYQDTAGNDIENNSEPLYIGTDTFEDDNSNGSIDDVRIYNRALSPSEVFELYQWGTRGRDMRKFTVNSRGL